MTNDDAAPGPDASPAARDASPDDAVVRATPADHPPGEEDTDDDLLDRLSGLWPTVIPRPTKTQLLALVLITLLSLGPVLALFTIINADVEPVVTLTDEGSAPTGGAHVAVTATNIGATAGELRIRVLVEPDPATLVNGRPARELTLTVNDARGDSTKILPAGQPIVPAEFTLALTDGSVRQFPFDAYTAPLFVLLTAEQDGEAVIVPMALELRSAVDGFALTTTMPADAEPTDAAVREATFDARRATTTVVYVVWIMILMYGLAISGVLLLWAVVIRRLEVPIWAFGLFVGVLFALPPLRLALPGNPPLGVLVDYVSFYWAVTIVGITLLWLVAVGIRQHRATAEQRAQARTEIDQQLDARSTAEHPAVRVGDEPPTR